MERRQPEPEDPVNAMTTPYPPPTITIPIAIPYATTIPIAIPIPIPIARPYDTAIRNPTAIPNALANTITVGAKHSHHSPLAPNPPPLRMLRPGVPTLPRPSEIIGSE